MFVFSSLFMSKYPPNYVLNSLNSEDLISFSIFCHRLNVFDRRIPDNNDESEHKEPKDQQHLVNM